MNHLYKALNGANSAPQNVMGQSLSVMPQAAGNPIFARMQQIAGMFRNPQALVQNYFPDAPAEVQGDPDRLIGWLQQTGRVNPQMIRAARQMMGR